MNNIQDLVNAKYAEQQAAAQAAKVQEQLRKDWHAERMRPIVEQLTQLEGKLKPNTRRHTGLGAFMHVTYATDRFEVNRYGSDVLAVGYDDETGLYWVADGNLYDQHTKRHTSKQWDEALAKFVELALHYWLPEAPHDTDVA